MVLIVSRGSDLQSVVQVRHNGELPVTCAPAIYESSFSILIRAAFEDVYSRVDTTLARVLIRGENI